MLDHTWHLPSDLFSDSLSHSTQSRSDSRYVATTVSPMNLQSRVHNPRIAFSFLDPKVWHLKISQMLGYSARWIERPAQVASWELSYSQPGVLHCPLDSLETWLRFGTDGYWEGCHLAAEAREVTLRWSAMVASAGPGRSPHS